MTTAVIYGSPAGYSTLFGNTTGDDEIIALGYGNTILSGGANDQIYTGNGTALVELGSFNNVTDSVNLTGAFNEVFAGPETDSSLTIQGSNGNSLVDLINAMGPSATAYNNVTLGGSYNDIILNGNAFNNVVAGSSNATVTIGTIGDGLYGYTPQIALEGTGNTVSGGDEGFNISGAQGESSITLGNGLNRINVSGPKNVISVGWNSNFITSLSGRTTITVTGDNPLYPIINYTDTIKLGGTNNVVTANHGDENFIITGGSGNSTYTLGDGLLTITTAGSGNTISGGNGNGDSVTDTGALGKITLGNGIGDSVVANGNTDTIKLGNGAGDSVTANGATDSVTVGNGGGDTVTANGTSDTVSVGNGNGDVVTANGAADTVTVGTGVGDKVTANGTGDTITDGSTGSVLTAGGDDDTITFTGTGTLSATGSNDVITATPAGGGLDTITIGDNSFLTLTGSAMGSFVTSTGLSNTVILAGNASAEVNDAATGGDLELALVGSGGSYTGTTILDGFGADPSSGNAAMPAAVIDLVGLSGLTSFGAVLAATTSDGLGGVKIALPGGGSLDITHIIGGLDSSQFAFNVPTTSHI